MRRPATVAAGVLVGRWWLLLVPRGAALVVIVGFLLSERDPGEWWDADPADYALGYFIAGVVIVALLAIGVAGHKLLAATVHRVGAPKRPGGHKHVPSARG